MSGPVIHTPSGKVRGRTLEHGGALFAGVPFAAAPTGALRFRPPQPHEGWADVRDASGFGPAPVQPPPAAGELEMSEDCLTLNVWTPAVDGAAPVFVWVYGGGFEGGSASPPFFDGARFMQRTGCVVVAANYRVGALGWADVASIGGPAWAGASNAGLRDIAAALAWVAAAAAAFGGEAGNVTLGGESAGAFCVGALLASPLARGTFRRAILQSGSTTRVLPRERASTIAGAVVERLGLAGPDALAAVDASELIRVQREVIDADLGRRNTPGGRIWGVVLDGDSVPVDPQAAVRNGDAAGIDVLVGANLHEARLWAAMLGVDGFAPRDRGALLDEIRRCFDDERANLLLDAYDRRGGDLTEIRTAFLSDWIYRAPAARLARDHRAAGGRAFSYLFAGQPFGPRLGAFHAAELPFVFDGLERPFGPMPAPGNTPELVALRDDMIHAWGAFVRTGEPGWASEDGVTRGFGSEARFVRELPDDVAPIYADAPFRT